MIFLWGTVCHHVEWEVSRFIPSILSTSWLRATDHRTQSLRQRAARGLSL